MSSHPTPARTCATPRIRLATRADAAPLAILAEETFVATFGHLYRPEDLAFFVRTTYSEAIQGEELADATNTHFIAEAEGMAVGYAKLGAYKLPKPPSPTPALELHRLYIRDGYQGQGIGDALMQACLEEAAARGAKSIYLGVWENNFGAQRFYARYGFEQVGTHTFAVGDHLDCEFTMRTLCKSS